MQHYRIFLYDTDKINKHPKNENIDDDDFRWKFEGDLVKMYNVLVDVCKSVTTINTRDGNSITTKDRFTYSQLSVLYYYGISITDYSPEREYIDGLIDELSKHLNTCIKNRYNVSDKLYSIIKELKG